jgi:hypothetical protein
MIKPIFCFVIPFLQAICGCQLNQGKPELAAAAVSRQIENTDVATLVQRFVPPAGFVRPVLQANSFGHYLQNLPLKPVDSPVHLYNGQLKARQSVHAAVVDMDTGDRDLQQCADAVMRLRAEYLFTQKQYDQIHFKLTNGFEMDYTKWRQGYRVRVDGNKTEWYPTNTLSTNYESFRKYLDFVFMYAGTLSLSKEMQPKQVKDLAIGDVFIQGGSPGHAVIVVDVVVKDDDGEKIFLLAQSYMPAQEIHVLKNPNDVGLSPWFSADFGEELVTPEWTFRQEMLMQF